MIDDLLAELTGDPLERLRWLIFCSFGVLPGSPEAMQISDADIIRAGLNLILDLRNVRYAQQPDFNSFSSDINDSFDTSRFELLANGDSTT